MAVIVIRGTVDNGEGLFFPGDMIIGLSERDEDELVACGACRYADGARDDDNTDGGDKPSEIDENGLIKLPGGFYQLPNGEKVRGKDKALAALADLNQGDDDDHEDGSSDDNNLLGGPATDIVGAQ